MDRANGVTVFALAIIVYTLYLICMWYMYDNKRVPIRFLDFEIANNRDEYVTCY